MAEPISPILFLEGDGTIPPITISSANSNGQRWVALGGLYQNLQEYQSLLSPNSRSKHSISRISDLNPRPFDPKEPWMPYYPTEAYDEAYGSIDNYGVILNSQRPEYWFIDIGFRPSITSAGPRRFRLREAMQKKIIADLNECWTSIEDLRVIQPEGIVLPTPMKFDTSNLGGVYSSDEMVSAEALKAGDAMLTYISWLSWWDKNFWDEKLEPATISTFNYRLYLNKLYGLRGVRIDLDKDLDVVDISSWVKEAVTIYYPWKKEYEDRPKLAKLNPDLILAERWCRLSEQQRVDSQNDPRNTAIPFYGPSLRKAAAETLGFDMFLQPIDFRKPVAKLLPGTPIQRYVIDFLGWKRRLLGINSSTELYSTLFMSSSIQLKSDTNEDLDIQIFYRFKPKSEQPMVPDTDNPAPEFNLPRLRTLHCLEYGPIQGKRFHHITGVAIERNIPEPPRLLQRLTSPTPRYSLRNQTSSPRQDPVRENRSRSLSSSSIARRPLTPSHSPSSARSFHSYQPSSSPVLREYDRGRVSSTDQIQRGRDRRMAFKDELERRSERILSSDLPLRLSPFKPLWNPTLLKVGYLIVWDTNAALRIRCIANRLSFPEGSPEGLEILLNEALQRRIPFSIGVQEDDLPRFRQNSVDVQRNLAGVVALYDSAYQDKLLEHADTHEQRIAEYQARMLDISSRPHAASLSFLGGPFSYILEKLGPPNVLYKVAEGPSQQSVQFRRGKSDLADADRLGLYWDGPLVHEAQVLLGCAPAYSAGSKNKPEKYLFPPLEVLGKCDFYTGEWTRQIDDLFNMITERWRTYPITQSALTAGEWMKWLKNYSDPRAKKYIPPGPEPEDFEDVEELFKRVNRKMNWKKTPLSKIPFDESHFI